MARRLRLHFASRRSCTDPLSETRGLGGGDWDPGRPRGSCMTSTLQISLQPWGQGRGDGGGEGIPGAPSGGSPSIGDPAPGLDGGSCDGSTASDGGYCSSGSIFEPDAPAPAPAPPRARLPLRRCSSLVIFPHSPCGSPPASPVSTSAAASFHTCRQVLLRAGELAGESQQAAPRGQMASAIDGLRLPKTGGPSAELQDTRPVPSAKGDGERSERHSSVLLHFAQQRPLAPDRPEPRYHHVKLFRSTSACQPDRTHSHHALQRSVSLEVPHPRISCHFGSKRGPPHVHIHVSHGSEGLVGAFLNSANGSRKPDHVQNSPGRNARVRGCLSFPVWLRMMHQSVQ